MESAIRYDFSFPPKSSSLSSQSSIGSLNTNQFNQAIYSHQRHYHNSHHQHNTLNHHHQQHHHHQAHSNNSHHNHHHQHHNAHMHHDNQSYTNPISLPKSASASLLLSFVSQNNNLNNNNNNNNNNSKYNSVCNSCNNVKECSSNNNNNTNAYNLNKSANNKMKNSTSQYNSMMPSQTVATSNTNTASTQSTSTSTSSSNSNNLNGPVTPKDNNCSFTFDDLKNTLAFMEDSPLINTNNTSNSANTNQLTNNVLLVIPTQGDTASVSSLSSSSSSSSSSCNSCYVQPYLPKSNSNPMLVSSSSSAVSTSPSCISPQSACACDSTVQTNNLNTAQSNPVLDLLMKKTIVSEQESETTFSPNASNLVINEGPVGFNNAIENAAKKYRCAAQISEATCCWKGKLPPKQYKTPIVYSTKVFVGGLPWDITEEDLIKEFGVFGPCRVEWTNKERYNLLGNSQQAEISFDSNQNNNANSNNNSNSHKGKANQNNDGVGSVKHRMSPGFAYVIYDSEFSVRNLVGNCIEDYQNGRDRVEYFFKISTRRVRNKEVQIIPWILADNNFALCTPKELDPKKTVFVGNLHGTMTARDLAHIMNELFGCVVYAGIDIDKLKYPIGSGRVTFSHQQNFMRAVRAAFVDIQSNKFTKRIQIDPYLEDVQCCVCYGEKGIYFCRNFQCFNYYCGRCWSKQHNFSHASNHKPLMRKREDKL